MFRKIKIVLFFLVITGFLPLMSKASSLALSPDQIVVRVGESFSIKVNAISGQTSAYTVKMGASFTPGILRLNTWNFNGELATLRQPGYDAFDNSKGILVRTAGFPQGFSGVKYFGTANFVASSVGDAIIELNGDSFIYDENTNNTYTGGNRVSVKVLPQEVKTPPPPPSPSKPEVASPVVVTTTEEISIVDHKFDIALVLQKSKIALGNNISALVHLTNLSSKIEPMDVPLRFRIINSEGMVVIDEQKTVSVNEPNLKLNYNPRVSSLPEGIYNIIASVELQDLLTPAESKGEFIIETPSSAFTIMDPKVLAVIAVLILIILILFIFLVRKSHEIRKQRLALRKKRKVEHEENMMV